MRAPGRRRRQVPVAPALTPCHNGDMSVASKLETDLQLVGRIYKETLAATNPELSPHRACLLAWRQRHPEVGADEAAERVTQLIFRACKDGLVWAQRGRKEGTIACSVERASERDAPTGAGNGQLNLDAAGHGGKH